MRLEDMKNGIPETPEFIHLMIQDKVKKQLPKCTEPSKTACSGSMVYQIKNEYEKQKRPADEKFHLRDVSAILCFFNPLQYAPVPVR